MKLMTVVEVALSLPKTILFNVWYLPWRQAIRLPILVSRNVWLRQIRGEVLLPRSLPTASVRIGFGDIGIFDRKRSRSIWEVRGRVFFGGRCAIGHGCKVSASGDLYFGEGVALTAESTIVAKKSVRIGNNTLISWDVLIMDSDLHHMTDAAGNVGNPQSAVVVGDGVWLGCRSLVLKGVSIPDGCVVAAGSVVSRTTLQEHSLLAGSPAKVVKDGVYWRE